MNAVDTNVLVRWITRDDVAQAALADRVMRTPVRLSLSVLVELAWVLGGKPYRLDRPTLAAVLLGVVETNTVHVEQEEGVRWGIARLAAGADFTDMIHLLAARGAAAFATFDQRLAGAAGADAPVAIETLG